MLQHIYFFSGPLIVVVAILMGIRENPIYWWHLPLIMGGAAIYDLGWHSAIHHRNLWTARWYFRAIGLALAGIGVAI